MPRKPENTVGIYEAAEILGVHINTVYNYIKKGEIKAVKYFNRWIFSKSELEEYRDKMLEGLR